MKGKALLLILLAIFAASSASFALSSVSAQFDKENSLTSAYSITPADDGGEGVGPQGIPIDTPTIPT